MQSMLSLWLYREQCIALMAITLCLDRIVGRKCGHKVVIHTFVMRHSSILLTTDITFNQKRDTIFVYFDTQIINRLNSTLVFTSLIILIIIIIIILRSFPESIHKLCQQINCSQIQFHFN